MILSSKSLISRVIKFVIRDTKKIPIYDTILKIYHIRPTLVMMQIFNEINARKIHGERSVFKGIFDNPLFYGIVIGTLVTQVLIIEMAGVVFACTSLSVAQWMFCTCVGLFELIWQQFICFVPDTVLDSCFAPKVSKVWLKVGWGLIFPTFRVF